MPEPRRQRGSHPADRRDFGDAQLPTLRRAMQELSWLLDRGYPAAAAGVLVGNRHALRARQRAALQRAVASAEECAVRRARRLPPSGLRGRPLLIDGYNALLTVEVALGGGVVVGCRDGTARDVAAMSRHYRQVSQTRPALVHIGDWLATHAPSRVEWLLDRPVSNSGRLARTIEAVAESRAWPWTVRLEDAVDARLAAAEEVVATADGAILDRCAAWVNLARVVVEGLAGVWWIELGPGGEASASL